MAQDIFVNMYREAQKNCELKVDDLVKIVGTARSFMNMDGFAGLWSDYPDGYIGNMGRVIRVVPTSISVVFNTTVLELPYFVLKKVDVPFIKDCLFKPFDRVLVRDSMFDIWKPALFGYYRKDGPFDRYFVIGGLSFKQCIPYKGNECLVGIAGEPKAEGKE